MKRTGTWMPIKSPNLLSANFLIIKTPGELPQGGCEGVRHPGKVTGTLRAGSLSRGEAAEGRRACKPGRRGTGAQKGCLPLPSSGY